MFDPAANEIRGNMLNIAYGPKLMGCITPETRPRTALGTPAASDARARRGARAACRRRLPPGRKPPGATCPPPRPRRRSGRSPRPCSQTGHPGGRPPRRPSRSGRTAPRRARSSSARRRPDGPSPAQVRRAQGRLRATPGAISPPQPSPPQPSNPPPSPHGAASAVMAPSRLASWRRPRAAADAIPGDTGGPPGGGGAILVMRPRSFSASRAIRTCAGRRSAP